MKKRMKKVATLCLAGVTAMSTVGVTGSAVFAKGDTNYDVDNMDFENVELRVAFRFNNGSDTDGQAKWYYKALDEFNKENEGKIHDRCRILGRRNPQHRLQHREKYV